ncbi:MAG: DUF4280 domain-containing protein [Desulfobacterota bacterium]|jgi:Domain of unknown function (DUF4280)|nr:DUF4280 domain-containing protein [Thermodesulfobacteriota bacterium]
MSQLVVSGATLMCSFGAAPGTLTVMPTNRTMCSNMPAANIMDNIPMVNIMPFGMCMSITNPSVASATSAALGVLTPMPCVPVTTAPWAPGSTTVMIANMPALSSSSQCMCSWGGAITISFPGQVTTNVP